MASTAVRPFRVKTEPVLHSAFSSSSPNDPGGLINILILSPFPVHGRALGGVRRIDLLARHFARNHRVSVVCIVTPDTAIAENDDSADQTHLSRYEIIRTPVVRPRARLARHLRRLPAGPLHYHVEGTARRVRDIVREDRIDLVHAEFFWLGLFLLDQAITGGAVSILAEQELPTRRLAETVRLDPAWPRKCKGALAWAKYRHLERRVSAEVDLILTTTTHEKRALEGHCRAGDIVVFPNLVDPAYFRPRTGAADPRRVLFVGNFRHRPNVDGLVWYCREVAPRLARRCPDVVTDVVGVGAEVLPEVVRSAGSLNVVGAVSDVRDHLGGAALSICPMVTGGGMRGKVLESLSMERPVVSTERGAEGNERAVGKGLVVARGAEGFCREIEVLLADCVTREARGKAGRRIVSESFSPRAVLPRLEERFEALVSARSLAHRARPRAFS